MAAVGQHGEGGQTAAGVNFGNNPPHRGVDDGKRSAAPIGHKYRFAAVDTEERDGLPQPAIERAGWRRLSAEGIAARREQEQRCERCQL
jgi:hypothetical protein